MFHVKHFSRPPRVSGKHVIFVWEKHFVFEVSTKFAPKLGPAELRSTWQETRSPGRLGFSIQLRAPSERPERKCSTWNIFINPASCGQVQPVSDEANGGSPFTARPNGIHRLKLFAQNEVSRKMFHVEHFWRYARVGSFSSLDVTHFNHST
jgi:hypothetical protein